MVMAVPSGPSGATEPQGGAQRICNPLPLPNYPVGRRVRDIALGEPAVGDSLWLQPDPAGPRRLILSGGGELFAVRVEP